MIFHSAQDRAYAQENKLLAEKKQQLTVGGWGEDLQRHIKRPLPSLDRGVLFLMATPLDRLQGIVEFCEAAKALRLKARRARFFLASTPGDAASPLPTAILRQYREFVQYIGPVDDPSRLIARCHVIVAPSYGNGAPRSLFQALALGRPIITTDTRSCRDFVKDGINGYHVAVRDGLSGARNGSNPAASRPHAPDGRIEQTFGSALLRYELRKLPRSRSARPLSGEALIPLHEIVAAFRTCATLRRAEIRQARPPATMRKRHKKQAVFTLRAGKKT